jgi:hypothetical protein
MWTKIKAFFAAIWKFILSLFTDKDFDGDATKLFGLALIVIGVAGWFKGLDPTFIIGFGAVLVATGKFSAQG